MASRSVISLPSPPRARQQSAVAIEKAAQQIHPPERGRGEQVRLRAELDHLLRGARRVVGERRVRARPSLLSGPAWRRVRATTSISGPVSAMSLACLLVTTSPIVCRRRSGAERPTACARRRRRRAAAARSSTMFAGSGWSRPGIAGDVMEQRRAGEVAVRRLEIGARMHQRRVRREQAPAARRRRRHQRRQRVGEARVRRDLVDAARERRRGA